MLTHGVHMATILAVSSFLSRLKQVVKDVLYGYPMRRVCLVKGKHVDEDDYIHTLTSVCVVIYQLKVRTYRVARA